MRCILAVLTLSVIHGYGNIHSRKTLAHANLFQGERVNAGMGEWNGAWADGSKEWTSFWLEKLNHRFGNDGVFWMSYEDLCKRFDLLDRTRLFDNEWTVVQSWTSVSVAWVTGYLNTKFVVEIKKAGPTVFVLCQLDHRYFKGLRGKYTFDLHFVLQEKNTPVGDYIVRARGAWFGNRSVSAEVTLEPGKYEVVPKIVAERDADTPDVYDVVTKVADRNPQKLRQIGMNYDIANAKGIVQLTPEEKKKNEEKKKEADDKKKKEKEEADKEKAEFEAWKKEKKEREEKAKVEQEKAEKAKTELDDKTASIKNDSEPAPALPEVNTSTETTTSTAQQPTPDEEPNKHSSTDPPPINPPNESTTNTSPTEPLPPTSPSTAAPPAAPHQPSSPHNDHLATGPPRPLYYAASEAALDPPLPQPPSQDGDKKWNAICVLGLRVYSQDPEVSIKLAEPRSAEEGALLDVDGVTQAGATMA